MIRKKTKKYYFSVEGETEQKYLDHLATLINGDCNAKTKVVINSQKRNPLSYAKNIATFEAVEITHLFDFESQTKQHHDKFHKILGEMSEAKKIKGKVKNYFTGHSNFTFELWIILHKKTLNCKMNNRSEYLSHINREYSEKFSDMDEYKRCKNFERILSKISIDDVYRAIKRAKDIDKINLESGYSNIAHRGYKYYVENPSLMIHHAIAKILDDVYN